MKKTLSLLAALIVALMLFGCGGDDSAPAETAAQPEAQAAPEVDVVELATEYVRNIPSHKNIVQVDDIMDRLLADEDLYIVDIRRADDYNQGHLPGAVNMPWGTPDIYEMMRHLPTDRPVYSYCYSGQTCGQWIALMQLGGIDARSVMLGWNRGLSKHERLGEVVESEPSEIDTGFVNDVPDEVYDAVAAYFQDMATRAGTPFASNIISAENAKAIFDAEDPDVVFVSQRRPDDYAQAHVPGAVNIPYNSDMIENMASVPSDKRLIMYCYTGQSCGQSIAILRVLGYDAFSMNSGFGTPATMPAGWNNQGFPVESSS